jgi:hypothetical protein
LRSGWVAVNDVTFSILCLASFLFLPLSFKRLSSGTLPIAVFACPFSAAEREQRPNEKNISAYAATRRMGTGQNASLPEFIRERQSSAHAAGARPTSRESRCCALHPGTGDKWCCEVELVAALRLLVLVRCERECEDEDEWGECSSGARHAPRFVNGCFRAVLVRRKWYRFRSQERGRG